MGIFLLSTSPLHARLIIVIALVAFLFGESATNAGQIDEFLTPTKNSSPADLILKLVLKPMEQ